MRVPVRLLTLGQRAEQPAGDDVLDADQVGVAPVAVEQHALQEILVDLAAVVVGLHLHAGLVLGAVQPGDVDVEVLERRRVLQQPGAGFQCRAPQRLPLPGRRDRAWPLLMAGIGMSWPSWDRVSCPAPAGAVPGP
jgi:hypothetical protein